MWNALDPFSDLIDVHPSPPKGYPFGITVGPAFAPRGKRYLKTLPSDADGSHNFIGKKAPQDAPVR